ncbi:tRNA(fMet)-specific endonuclease VapC [Sphingobium fontiphilum]|uniref:Ribonuclease VapC n=1 Tax=Sphingobium fontiphilum TaxID=944425 RepID=A0A7W6GPM4_9SPHN|nr:tRNA(fMet)-specific endonuclease VapC [Sphingobium fontiphilum]
MFLLDTNVCIDFALARSDALRDRVRASYAAGLNISAITLAELRVGARHRGTVAEDGRKLDMMMHVLSVRPFDAAAAEIYGRMARAIGVRRKSFDRLIAAHALSLGLTLVTRNEADFADVPGLKVENWAA